MTKIYYTLYTDGTWHAYFEGLPKFYGSGNTKQEALEALKQKLIAVLEAIAKIQSGV